MKKNFVNQLNNPEKMSPTLYLSIDDFEYEGKALLWVYVLPTSTVGKCTNRIYDRNEDGDMDITDSPIPLNKEAAETAKEQNLLSDRQQAIYG